MTPMFQPDPSGRASVSDRVRGCIALAICIGSFTGANYATNVQWQVFFMITAILNMCVALGIIFKEV